MNTFAKISTTAAIALFAGAGFAQELKIGYVNLEKVLKDSAPAVAAQSKLQSEFNRREKDLTEQGNRFKAATEKFEKEAGTLGESEKLRRQRDLTDQNREFERKRREFQEDLNQRKNEELAGLVDRTNRIVKQIFDQEKYDLIVQEVVFASSRVEITDKVIKALNAGTK